MGFEDDANYSDSFETDAADLDAEVSAPAPKKRSLRDLREAKKKNAEKTANLPKQRGGLFSRRTRLDDDDSLSGQHLFDPTQETKISVPRDNRNDDEMFAPRINSNSEFSFLFDPSYDDETEDDVYPDSSRYSSGSFGRDLCTGLAYDEARDGESADYDRLFSEDNLDRSPSRFTFNKREARKKQEEDMLFADMPIEDTLPEPIEPPASPKPVKVTPTLKSSNEDFLPELRNDSVFSPSPEPIDNVPVMPSFDREKREDDFMPQENNDQPQEPMSYPVSDVYSQFPMQPMMGYPMGMPMNMPMPYPMNMPVSNNAMPQGGMPYQAIPIPYPVMMPYPMYQYPPMYPPYGGPDPYDRYYDDRRYARRERYYDDYREPRRERADRGYDERYRSYERESYPQPSYRPPYESGEYGRAPYDDRYSASPANAKPASEPTKDTYTAPAYEPTKETYTAPAYEPTKETYTAPVYEPTKDAYSAPITEPFAETQPITAPITDTELSHSSSDLLSDIYSTPLPETSPIMMSDPIMSDFNFNETSDSDSDFSLPGFGNSSSDSSTEQDDELKSIFGGSDFNLGFGSSNGFENPSASENGFGLDLDGNDNSSAAPPSDNKPRGGRFNRRK